MIVVIVVAVVVDDDGILDPREARRDPESGHLTHSELEDASYTLRAAVLLGTGALDSLLPYQLSFVLDDGALIALNVGFQLSHARYYDRNPGGDDTELPAVGIRRLDNAFADAVGVDPHYTKFVVRVVELLLGETGCDVDGCRAENDLGWNAHVAGSRYFHRRLDGTVDGRAAEPVAALREANVLGCQMHGVDAPCSLHHDVDIGHVDYVELEWAPLKPYASDCSAPVVDAP